MPFPSLENLDDAELTTQIDALESLGHSLAWQIVQDQVRADLNDLVAKIARAPLFNDRAQIAKMQGQLSVLCDFVQGKVFISDDDDVPSNYIIGKLIEERREQKQVRAMARAEEAVQAQQQVGATGIVEPLDWDRAERAIYGDEGAVGARESTDPAKIGGRSEV